MTSYQYRKSHCGDKTILRLSYLRNGISYAGKMIFLYWIKALNSILEIRYSLISTIGFPILVRRHVYIQSGPRVICPIQYHLFLVYKITVAIALWLGALSLWPAWGAAVSGIGPWAVLWQATEASNKAPGPSWMAPHTHIHTHVWEGTPGIDHWGLLMISVLMSVGFGGTLLLTLAYIYGYFMTHDPWNGNLVINDLLNGYFIYMIL